ncbi:RNA polymerase sigma factor [uncultured Caudovirales phage]|uniref:RNA polymerase sigma factor n=1 Tax=uncultured Caudovirales phage TaxID=2100421 RepID=A0A6J7XBX4_9CAUD|nr:RNA polymerase sigma factor [uncultured Caudovirales phage]
MKKNALTTHTKKSKKNNKKKDVPLLLDLDLLDLDQEIDVPILDIETLIPAVAPEIKNEDVEVKKKIKPKDKVHYVNSREFEDEIRNYYKTDSMTDKLCESLNKIANGLSYAPNFMNYSYKEEMVGDAIVKMFSALKNKKFKIDCGFSPFSYFTTIAFHAFINRIKKEKKHHEAVNEYREKVYNDLMLNPDENGGAHIYIEPTGDDEE